MNTMNEYSENMERKRDEIKALKAKIAELGHSLSDAINCMEACGDIQLGSPIYREMKKVLKEQGDE